MSEVRRGRFIAIRGANGAAVVAQAAEGLDADSFRELASISGGTPALTITARRAVELGLGEPKGKTDTLLTDPPLSIETAQAIADPLAAFNLGALKVSSRDAKTYDSESAAVTLAKLARLLPSAVTAPIESPDAEDLARGRT